MWYNISIIINNTHMENCMKAPKMTLTDHWKCKRMSEQGLGPSEIASKLGFSREAIRLSLKGENRSQLDEKARRMNAFGLLDSTGNYTTKGGRLIEIKS